MKIKWVDNLEIKYCWWGDGDELQHGVFQNLEQGPDGVLKTVFPEYG